MELVIRMLGFRPIALLFALTVLSSCAYGPDNSVFAGGRCDTYSAEHLQGVDWQEANKLNLRIRQGDFLPVYMGLQQNRSYVLSIENADDIGHTFRAMEFFRAVAVAGVRVDGGEFEQVSCLKGVSIPAGRIMEIRLVAIRDGSYEFDDNSLMFSLAMIGSAGGFITIEPPRILPVSPLEHLKLFERKPIETAPEESKPTGLFDDQEEDAAPEPGSLFDDGEPAPDEPPSGLFDDAAPEQPIDGSPSVPVETLPDPFSDTEPAPDDGLFGEPSLETEPPEPEAPLVDAPPPSQPDGLDENLFDEPSPEPSPATTVLEPLDSESDMMMEEEAPVVDTAPETAPEIPQPELFEGEEEFFVEEEIIPDDAAPPPPPLALPDGYDTLEGPPADIFSDPPDVVNSGPDSGGAAGDDQFDG